MLNCGLTSSVARASSLALLWSIIPAASSHAIPQKTHTVELRELNVLPWPLPTVMPGANHLLGRQLNTVCGYVGGNPDLPATCSAGSHCAIDVEHGVVGCCPDGGPCTQGVYTGCVDGNSDPQTEINPYVYTCGGGNVCYQNQFAGGYHQYGCGSASDLATTVAMSASGKQTLDLTSISLEFTATATSLSEPTTLGTKSSSKSDSSTTSSLKTTSSKTSSTGTAGTSSDSNPTSTGGANGGDGDKDNANDEAPKDSNNSPPIGAIVGGTVGGVALLALLALLAIFLIRRRKEPLRDGPQGEPKFSSSDDSDNTNVFTPLHPTHEMDRSFAQTYMNPVLPGDAVYEKNRHHPGMEPAREVSPNDYVSPITIDEQVMAGGRGRDMETDQQPLREPENAFGYNGALSAIYELDDDPQGTLQAAQNRSVQPEGPLSEPQDHDPTSDSYESAIDPYTNPYRGRRGTDSGSFWQQNRRTTKDEWI
ncbi:unnamed protein product [Clonostachys byssicola]|uniref:Uncharacterized protein n=1 Tax=Clonostachys byssicola TaxID=160290 RepID=A0A9N9Y6S6_9HYPO|nr:unnamed protein product [Clonostachys byssicola]